MSRFLLNCGTFVKVDYKNWRYMKMNWKELKDHIEVGIIHTTLFPEVKNDENILLETVDLITHDLLFDRIKIRKELKNRLHITRMKITYATASKISELNLNINSIDKTVRSVS
jgi:hypothetical protein